MRLRRKCHKTPSVLCIAALAPGIQPRDLLQALTAAGERLRPQGGCAVEKVAVTWMLDLFCSKTWCAFSVESEVATLFVCQHSHCQFSMAEWTGRACLGRRRRATALLQLLRAWLRIWAACASADLAQVRSQGGVAGLCAPLREFCVLNLAGQSPSHQRTSRSRPNLTCETLSTCIVHNRVRRIYKKEVI